MEDPRGDGRSQPVGRRAESNERTLSGSGMAVAPSDPAVQSIGMETSSEGHDGDDLRTSLGKAISLLAALGVGAAGVSTLARETGVPKSTAFRLLSVLEHRGLVERAGRHYRLGAKVFEIGSQFAYCQPESLRDVALPHMVDLWSRTNATIHLAIRDGVDVLYLEKLHSHGAVATPAHVGGRLPAHCTAIGKALLAHPSRFGGSFSLDQLAQRHTRYTIASPHLFVEELRKVREQGHAIDREECRIGLACVAAPIMDERGHAIAAISISGRPQETDLDVRVPMIKRAAGRIAADLRGSSGYAALQVSELAS